MFNKLLKIINTMLVVIATILIGFSFGSTNVADEIGNAVDVKIAIVNNDNGVETKDGENKYFSKQFLNDKSITEDKSYQTTSLELAKNGMNDGKFTGYIVIPNDFSENVVSIDTTRTKSTLIYNVSTKDSSVLEKSLNKINNIVSVLDKEICEYYVTDVLNEVNNAKVVSNSLKQDISDNDIIINGITPSKWLKVLKLDQAKIISVNDEDLRKYLNDLELSKEDIENQINDKVNGESEEGSELTLNYSRAKQAIDEYEKSRYYSIETDKIHIWSDVYLKRLSGANLSVLLEKETATLWVKCDNVEDYIVVKGNQTFKVNMNTSETGFYFSLPELNKSVIELFKNNEGKEYIIDGNVLVVYGDDHRIELTNNLLTIVGSNYMVVDGVTYIPQNGKIEILFEEGESSESNKINEYNSISSHIISMLNEISLSNQEILLTDAINMICNDTYLNEIISKYTNIGDVRSYIKTINEEYFVKMFKNEAVSGVNVNNTYTINSKRGFEIISGLEQTDYANSDILCGGTRIYPVDTEISNLAIVRDEVNKLQSNFDNYVSFVTNINYQGLDYNVDNINVSIDEMTEDLMNQVDENEKVADSNMDKLSEYEKELNESINGDMQVAKEEIQTNNSSSIKAIEKLNLGIRSYVSGDAVDSSAVDFIASAIEAKADELKSTEIAPSREQKRNNLYLLPIGVLVVAIGGISYMIYNQKKNKDVDGR